MLMDRIPIVDVFFIQRCDIRLIKKAGRDSSGSIPFSLCLLQTKIFCEALIGNTALF